jgi:hypothetical protein
MRQTVGGAQNVVTRWWASASSTDAESNRSALWMKTQAPAFQGAKKQLHACLAHPGEEMFRWTSPGKRPIQYIVDRCPTG